MEDAQSVADFGGKFCLVVGPGKVMVDGEAYNMFKSLNLFQWIASEVNSDDCDVPYSVKERTGWFAIGSSWVVCHCIPSSSYGRNLEFGHGTSDSSPPLFKDTMGSLMSTN